MPDALSAKLNDFAGYVADALDRHRSGKHADALGNMRKAAEAACKVLLLQKVSALQAASVIEGSNLQLLIGSVQRHAQVPQEVVNHLKALQIQGNKGVHDEPVMRSSATIGAVHLAALVQWLYAERLRMPLPKQLAEALSGKAVKDRLEAERRKQEEEQRAQAAHIAGLQARLDEIASAEARKGDERAALEAELAAIRAQADEGQALRKELTQLRLVVEKQGERAGAPALPPPAEAAAPKRTSRTWWWMAAVAAGIAISVMLVRTSGEAEPLGEDWSAPADTVLRVVLLPFQVLQDDPNLELRFEEVLRKHLHAHAAAHGIPAEIRLLREARALSGDDAVRLADSLHARLLFHGELTEPTATDSGAVSLHYVMRRMNSSEANRLVPLRFRTLAERATELLVATTGNLLDRAMANVHASKGEWSRALELLYASEPTTTEVDFVNRGFRVDCHARLGQFKEALREATAMVNLQPDNAYGWMLTANVLDTLGQLPEARATYEEALLRAPRHTGILTDLAELYLGASDRSAQAIARGLELALRAIEADSTSGRARFLAGFAAYAQGDWPQSMHHLERAIATGNAPAKARTLLAELLILRVSPADHRRAEALLLDAFRIDSTDARTLFNLGELYTRTPLADPEKAQAFYARARLSDQVMERERTIGLANAALMQGRNEEAISLIMPIWEQDSTNVLAGQAYAQALLNLKRYPEAVRVAEQLLAIDPLSKHGHMNLGLIHRLGDASVRDLPKAAAHYQAALRSDPFDTLALINLGGILFDLQDLNGTVRIMQRAVAAAPRSHQAHRTLALALNASGRDREALTHYIMAHELWPHDDLVASNLAYLLLAEGLTQDPARALALAEHSMRLAPSAPNRTVLAMALAKNDRFVEAAQQYSRAVAEDPTVRWPELEAYLATKGF
ncbi:MAG: tetratricopeptide repeat protein [Flavobacteriales bacterium]|nr:tetratricopeptide repeat protein [Flavobacteriales bacterium]